MATAAVPSSAFLSTLSSLKCNSNCKHLHQTTKYASFRVLAAKLPAGVELPKVEPKFKASFLGFTSTAEVWNSRAFMIGLIRTFIVELIMHKGMLQQLVWMLAKDLIYLFEKSS